jgi:hypothetical protein
MMRLQFAPKAIKISTLANSLTPAFGIASATSMMTEIS